MLAAVGPRSLNKQVLNALAQSGGDIRIYTPLEAGQAARKVENVSSVRDKLCGGSKYAGQYSGGSFGNAVHI